MDKQISIEPHLLDTLPDYTVIYLECNVINSPSTPFVTESLTRAGQHIAQSIGLDCIKKIPAIAATRNAYKILGKDPNRYRPSQEQLARRIVRGLGLYNVSTLVDAGNLFSLRTGWSIGIFDRDLIEGDKLLIGIGSDSEPYQGIGRGDLNICNLPVVRDSKGGIGTPTSDNERTKTSLDTRRISATVHIFDKSIADLEVITAQLKHLLTEHCYATRIETCTV